MELETVRQCFEKYVTYLKNVEGIECVDDTSIQSMSIGDMDNIIQNSFMEYVIKCRDKINQFGVPCTLYKHINSLVRQYNQDESNKTTNQLKDIIFQFQEDMRQRKESKMAENYDVPSNGYTPHQKQKGWFFG